MTLDRYQHHLLGLRQIVESLCIKCRALEDHIDVWFRTAKQLSQPRGQLAIVSQAASPFVSACSLSVAGSIKA
jgi:hypothetical protein